MAKFDSPYDRVRKLPKQFKPLRAYEEERRRGVAHTPEYDEQMRVLNAAFAGFYGGAATGFSFELEGVTRTDNAEWYSAGPTTSGERAICTIGTKSVIGL